jgi:hypothetical protein
MPDQLIVAPKPRQGLHSHQVALDVAWLDFNQATGEFQRAIEMPLAPGVLSQSQQ